MRPSDRSIVVVPGLSPPSAVPQKLAPYRWAQKQDLQGRFTFINGWCDAAFVQGFLRASRASSALSGKRGPGPQATAFCGMSLIIRTDQGRACERDQDRSSTASPTGSFRTKDLQCRMSDFLSRFSGGKVAPVCGDQDVSFRRQFPGSRHQSLELMEPVRAALRAGDNPFPAQWFWRRQHMKRFW